MKNMEEHGRTWKNMEEHGRNGFGKTEIDVFFLPDIAIREKRKTRLIV